MIGPAVCGSGIPVCTKGSTKSISGPSSQEAWIGNLEAKRAAAIEATDPDLCEKFLVYLQGAARYYRTEETSLYQFIVGLA